MANENRRPIEEQLAALGIPDDLPEAALQDAPVPDAATLARIRAKTFAKAGLLPASAAPRRTRRFALSVLAAAVALALVAVAALGSIGPKKVWATLVRFVPGFGLLRSSAPDGSDDRAVWLSAPHAVRVERDGMWVEVQGLVVSGGYVIARIQTEGVLLSKDLKSFVSVVTDQGSIMERAGWFAGSSSANPTGRDGQFQFKGAVSDKSEKLIVVVDGTLEWRLEIPLVPGDRLMTAEAFGPSASVGPYTLSAQITPAAGETAVTIMAQNTNGVEVNRLDEATLSVGDWTTTLNPRGGLNLQNVWHFTADALPRGTTSATVRVRSLTVLEPGEATVRLKLADATLNQTVQLGRWPLRLVRTELHFPRLLVFAAPGPPQVVQDATGTRSDHLFSVSGFDVNGEEVAAGGALPDPLYTGPLPKGMDSYLLGDIRLMEFDLTLPRQLRYADTVTVTMRDPQVMAKGPWVITVPLGQSPAGGRVEQPRK